MPGLGLIKGISDDAAELLEAAGVEKPLDLARQDVESLYPHLRTASRALKRPDALPERAEIVGWIAAARALVETISPGALDSPGNATASLSNPPQFRTDVGVSARVPRPAPAVLERSGAPSATSPSPVQAGAAAAPAPVAATGQVASAIDAIDAADDDDAAAAADADTDTDEDAVAAVELLDDDEDAPDVLAAVSVEDAELFDDDSDEEFELDAATVAAAVKGSAVSLKPVLPTVRTNDFSKDADTLAHLEKLRARREVDMGYGSTKVKEEDDIWKNVDKSAFATFNDYEDGKFRVQPLQKRRDDRESRSRVVERVDPKPQEEEKISRLVRRGINYPHPVMAYVAALFVLFFRSYMVVMVITLPIALIQLGDTFHEYLVPTAVIIGVFLLLGLINLIIISKVRCRVCSCPMFLSQRCFKNKKAHLINGLGYVASLALHLVIFQWFRCMYCGTAIRVRGAAKTTRMEVLDAKALDVDTEHEGPLKNF